MTLSIEAFIKRWSASSAAERANKDSFLNDLCEALGVPRPDPTTGDPERDVYVFERDVKLVHEGQSLTVGHIDLFKDGCFILEAKQGSDQGSVKLGTAKRGTPGWNIAMKDAFGQALGYAKGFDRPPPFNEAAACLTREEQDPACPPRRSRGNVLLSTTNRYKSPCVFGVLHWSRSRPRF